jgi:hypothetical protein
MGCFGCAKFLSLTLDPVKRIRPWPDIRRPNADIPVLKRRYEVRSTLAAKKRKGHKTGPTMLQYVN